MTRLALCALCVTLAACNRTRTDPRVAELKGSIHAVVRVVDVAEQVDCDSAGEWKEQLKCRFTRAPRTGCTYVELGAEADTPLQRTSVSIDDCNSLPGSRTRVAMQPIKKAELFVDAAQQRVVLSAGPLVWAFYVKDGALLDVRELGGMPTTARLNTATMEDRLVDFSVKSPLMTTGQPDWSAVPSMLWVAPAHPSNFSEAEIDALIAATPDGARVFNDALGNALRSRQLVPSSPEWARYSKRLDAKGRERVRDALLELVRDGDEEAVGWAEGNEDVPRAQLVEELVGALASVEYGSAPLMDALLRLAPEDAEPLACSQLETLWLDEDQYDDLAFVSASLALIAREKLKCAWVTPWLERLPCNFQFRERNETTDDASEPLLSAKKKAKALKLLFTPEAEWPDDAYEEEGQWAAVLLLAAEAQGPLPPDFLKRNLRRTYRHVYTFKGAEEDDSCRNTMQPPSEWACRMPLGLTQVYREGCTMKLDDASQTMTLTSDPMLTDE